MRSLRRPAVVVSLVSILLWGGPATQPSLLAGGGAPIGQPARDGHPGPPDPCELALTPEGQANGLHRRCEAAGSAGVARGDFNADGFADLAIGVPYEDLDGINAAGIVQVFYGSASGLTATGDQLFDIRTFGFALGSDDHFGWALAAGDFNGDGNSDLAIGVPEYESTGSGNHGLVLVIEGCRHRTGHQHRAQHRHAGRGARPRRGLARLGRLQRRRHRRPRDRRARLRGAR